jgi:hypothetical protein
VTELAVLVSVPPQVVVGTPATLMLAAVQVSVKVIGDSVAWLKLLTVIVIVDAPPGGTVLGANALAQRATGLHGDVRRNRRAGRALCPSSAHWRRSCWSMPRWWPRSGCAR